LAVLIGFCVFLLALGTQSFKTMKL